MVNKQQGQLEKNEKNEKSVIVCTYKEIKILL